MTPVLLANNPTFTRIIGPPGTNPTDPVPRPGGGGGTPDASIYLGVRLNGQYQFDNFGASTADGAPWAANMPFPNAWDTYEANIGKKVSACQWGGLAGSWPPRPFDTTAASAALKRAAFSQYD